MPPVFENKRNHSRIVYPEIPLDAPQGVKIFLNTLIKILKDRDYQLAKDLEDISTDLESLL